MNMLKKANSIFSRPLDSFSMPGRYTIVKRFGKPVGLLVLLAIAIAFPLVFSNSFVTGIALFSLMFAAAVTGWNIFSGYTGYISLGHATFFGLGAYALALMCQHWNVPAGYLPFLLVPVAGLIAAIFAIPLGLIALRVRRHTFVVITIAIFFIFQLLAFNLTQITNGSIGLGLPLILDWTGDFYNIPFYYVALAVLLVAIVISWFVRNSKYGLGLLAIRDDEDRALSLGVKAGPSKLGAFVISAFIVGMVGAVWAYYVFAVYPDTAFDATFDVAFALMSFLGGLGTIGGPILGALILESTQQYFTIYFGVQGYYLIIYGALFLVIILLLPRGIIPTLSERWTRFQAIRQQQQQENGATLTELSITGGVTDSVGSVDNIDSADSIDSIDSVEKTEGINL